MLLRHATPARNLTSILRAGLLCSKSQGKLPVVWLCSPCKSFWALLHTLKRLGGRAESTVIIEVSVPRRWLRRSARKRLWCCPRDIRPERIKGVLTFQEMAGTSADR
jgi:hypothetical protein